MSSPNELSFLPEDYLAKKARRRANILCGVLSVVVMGTIGSAFALSERSMRGLDAELADVEARYAEAAGRIEAVKKMHAKQRQIVQHAELAAALFERVPRSNLLATFTNALPAGVSLLELSLESKAQTSPNAAPTGGTAFDARAAALTNQKKAAPEAPKYDVFLKVTGVAENEVQVGEFISKLAKSPLLKDVNPTLIDSFVREKSTLRRFQLEMMVHPDANVAEASPPTAATMPTASAAAAEERK